MRTVCAILLLTVFMAASVTLGQRRSENPTRQDKTKTTPSENEANTEAAKAWGKYFLKCGDSYYCQLPETHTNLRKPICEFRLVSITTQELALSEPDRLNGIQRKLTSQFASKAERCYLTYYYHDYPDEWEKWGPGGQLSVNLIKQSGAWTVTTNFPFPPMTRTKNSCSDFPNALADSEQSAPLTNKTELQAPTRFRLRDDLSSKGSSWSRVDSVTWVENSPNGGTYTFRIIERTTVGEIQGTVLRRNPDNLDIFVPDINSGSVLVKFRVQGVNQWKPLREMVEVEPK